MPKRSTDANDRPNKKRKHDKKKKGVKIVDDDVNEGDMWVEKNIDMDGERVLATDIPTSESLKLTSSAISGQADPPLPPTLHTESKLQRDEWMLQKDESLTEGYGEPSENADTMSGGVDFFSTLGTEVKKKPLPERPDPDKACPCMFFTLALTSPC